MIGLPKKRKKGESPSGLSRRGFLQIAVVGIGGAALVAAGAGPSLLTRNSQNSDGVISLNRSDFARQLGKEFKVRKSPLEEVNIELAELTDIASGMADSQEENFSAIFRGPQNRPLEQNTYTLENAAIGAFPLFIVPVSQDGDAVYYEAIFNRVQG